MEGGDSFLSNTRYRGILLHFSCVGDKLDLQLPMHVLVVAPYPDLVETSREVASQDYPEVAVVEGDLEEGVRQARERIAAHEADIIVSRGGTASLLRSRLKVPIYEIHVTGYDLLRAIYPYVSEEKRIAVVGYANVVSGARSLGETLGYDLGYFLISQESDLPAVMQDVAKWGADIVVGDSVSVMTAQRHGIASELVRSGPEAVRRAVDAARSFYEHLQSEIVRNKRLNSILEHNDRGVLYLNSHGKVELANGIAERILHRSKDQLLGCTVDSPMFPSTLAAAIEKEAKDELIDIGERHYVVEVLPLQTEGQTVSTLVFLQSTGKIRDLEVMIRKQLTTRGLVAGYTFEEMVGLSPRFQKTIDQARRYALTDSTILLLGETGTGKEVFAQSIHNASSRSTGPFVAVNCAALPDSLLESELFGYAEGAFTGARKGGKPGLFEMAHRGTIFLDEVNDMSKTVQARFLRVLQEKQVMRVGDDRLHDVDVRVIAACNKNLYAETESGDFRRDLYYRLRVLDIQILPLRQRREDIRPIFQSFVDRFSRQYSYEPPTVPRELLAAIDSYHWPGNVRQLKNFAEKVSILFSIHEYKDDILADLISEIGGPEESEPEEPLSTTGIQGKTLRELESVIVRRVYEENGQNLTRTARDLGLDRATVRKKLGNGSG